MDAGTDPREQADDFAQLFPAVYHRFHRRLRPSEYRPTQESLAILRHLANTGPLTVGEAAQHFQRSQAAMSEILLRLEKRALVERVPDDRDRRRSLVWLTESGQSALQSSQRVLCERTLAVAFAEMQADDRAKLVEGMRALLETNTTDRGWDYD